MNASMRKLGWLLGVCGVTGAACLAAYRAAVPAIEPAPLKLLATAEIPTPEATPKSSLQVQPARFSPAVADVLRLLQAGVAKEVVRAHIQNSTTPYILSADDIVALNEQQVPSDLIVAMLARSGELQPRPGTVAGVPAPVLPQPGMVPLVAPAYEATQPAGYAPEAAEWVPPYSYEYPYPASYYSDWSYPAYVSWWWTMPYYGDGRGHPYYHRSGFDRPFYSGVQRQRPWPDAYPNHIIAGPNWGADRGFTTRPVGFAGRQRPWPDAYPNRVVAGPNWGADRGFTARPVATVPRPGAVSSVFRAGGSPGFAGRGHGGRG